jgi:hypothetical protein
LCYQIVVSHSLNVHCRSPVFCELVQFGILLSPKLCHPFFWDGNSLAEFTLIFVSSIK